MSDMQGSHAHVVECLWATCPTSPPQTLEMHTCRLPTDVSHANSTCCGPPGSNRLHFHSSILWIVHLLVTNRCLKSYADTSWTPSDQHAAPPLRIHPLDVRYLPVPNRRAKQQGASVISTGKRRAATRCLVSPLRGEAPPSPACMSSSLASPTCNPPPHRDALCEPALKQAARASAGWQ